MLGNERRAQRVSVQPRCRAQRQQLRSPQTVTPPLVAARGSRRPGHSKAATPNRLRDYAQLEREYITGTMSMRELCRRHGVTAHIAVMVQARQGDWVEKRRTYRSRASATFIERHADRAAAREAEVRDHAIEAIDEAISRFRADLHATERRLIGGEWVEVPAVRIGPGDLAILIDRLQILFGRPAQISEGRNLSATISTAPLPVDLLREIVEATRGLADTRAPQASPLPRWPPRLDDQATAPRSAGQSSELPPPRLRVTGRPDRRGSVLHRNRCKRERCRWGTGAGVRVS
jgi:hypothetical protein